MWKNYALISADNLFNMLRKEFENKNVNYKPSVNNNGSNFYNEGLDYYTINFEGQEIKIIPVQADPLSRFTRKFLFNSNYSDVVTFITIKNHKCKITREALKNIYESKKELANITQSERFRLAFTLKIFNKIRWERMG